MVDARELSVHGRISNGDTGGMRRMTLSRCGPVFITAIGLLLAMAGTLAPKEDSAGTGILAAPPVVPLPDWLSVATLAALTAASLILIAIRFPGARRPRRKGEEEYEMYYEPRKPPPAVVLLLILLVLTPPGIFAASILWLDRHEVLLHGRSGGPEKAPVLPKPSAGSPVHGEVPTRAGSPITADLLGALVLLGGFGSLAVVLWLRLGDRLWRLPPDDGHPQARLADTVKESLEDLRLEPDARAAIIKCYRRFEQAAAAARLPRQQSQTPAEFMRATLGRLPLPADAVRHLARPFETARFSQHV